MFFVAGIVCFLYYLMICFFIGRWNSTFSRFWIVCGALFLLCGIVCRQLPVSAAVLLTGICVVFWSVILVVCVRIYIWGKQKAPEQLDYLIVLGAKVDGRRITCSLQMRLDKACEYAAQYDQIKIIVSGGQGKGEDLPEARAMADYLQEKGIRRKEILIEAGSSTTRENLKFTAEIVPDIKTKKVGIVTNGFHLYRSCLIAKQEGYEKIIPVSARSEKLLFCNYIVREAFAILFLLIKQQRKKH